MSTIDEIMASVFISQLVTSRHECGAATKEAMDQADEKVRSLITAALADARREGAEAMRAAAAKLARRYPLFNGGGEEVSEELAQAIEDLPLPDAPARQHCDGLAHELWAAAQLVPGESVTDGVVRVSALLAENGLGVSK